MPLVRVEVRNEYRLGMPELYKEANREDPKALLDGVAVAGLVGILRQLGDLANFAAEVFHGLQEKAMNTCSRSHKLMVRVQKIEAALPPLEKTILAQRSHLHFAYTTGSNWHAHLQSEENHFIYGDLPSFIMDSYEECRGPPRFHFLDKFDAGGSGSCLKRYSDPTFFRRASAGFDEAYAEKVRRDKKARRRKKKKTGLKNGEVSHGESHGMPVSSHSGRMRYASRNCDEQTSPSQTVSTFDASLKSELGEKLHSFDSRAGSGYIECIFSPSYTMKSDGREPEEISSQFKLHGDTLDTSSLDKQRGVVDDDSQELIGSRSSCVTWDEKTEIREPIGPLIDSDETTVMILTNFDLDPPEGKAVKLRTDYQMDFIFDNESMQPSVSGGNQFDDIETETDNYMDALNTIDSESETDLECQTKREVEQFSTLNNKSVDEGIHRLTPQHSESHSLDFEPHVPDSEIHLECQTKGEVEQFSALNNKAVDEGTHSRLILKHSNSHSSNFEPNVPVRDPSNISISKENYSSVSPESPKEANSMLNKKASITKPNLVPSECQYHVQSPQKVAESSTLNIFPDIDSSGSNEILDGSNTENVVRNLSSSMSREPSLQTPRSDSTLKSSCESLNSPSLPSSVAGINFWTNGGLLGLEPSKPPDFSVLNSVHHDSVAKSKEETYFCSNQGNILEGDGNAVKTNIVKNSKVAKLDISSKCSTSCHNDQEDSISMMSTSWRSSQVQLDVKLEDSTDFHHNISSNESHKLGFCESSSKIPGTEEPVNPDAQATKSCEYDGKNSSRMFEFSNRLLVNGFQRKVSHVGGDNSVSSIKNGVSEQKSMAQEYQAFSGRTFKEQFGSRSQFMSPPSSPPLEHMKISFQPIDIFETSKLKLRFPDASGGNMFPSFQLVPEQSISLQDLGSDSDDDTFCRSSPNRSDDCLGHYSELDSEQWDAEESPRCKDDEIYDALCRISTTDSVSSDLEIGRKTQGVVVDNYELQNPFTENCMELYQCRVLDLPSFDTLNPSFGQELHKDFDAKYCQESDFSKEPAPPSPPLPLVEWQAMKPNLDVTIEKQDTSFEALKHAVDLKLSPSTTSQQPKPAPVKHDQNTKALVCTRSKQPDGQKLNGQKDAKQPTNGKEMDQKEDFLQQIKTNSFSLRRTVTAQPASTPGAPANVKVPAILERANAIRQAVGGDDDSWSDA